MSGRDPFDLNRFVTAQDGVFDRVRQELAAGRKQSHWMWFVFPQLAGLGRSQMAAHFAIRSAAEAVAYLAHPTLGCRLIACTMLVNGINERSVGAIFGTPDDLKFHSSMTLFAAVQSAERVFEEALTRYFEGAGDETTMRLLRP